MTRATLLERSSDSVRFRIDTTADALVSVVDITLHPASDRASDRSRVGSACRRERCRSWRRPSRFL